MIRVVGCDIVVVFIFAVLVALVETFREVFFDCTDDPDINPGGILGLN